MTTDSYLLDRIGGLPALRAVVDVFYDRILADDQLKNFFVGFDMSKLKLHQVNFLQLALTEIPADVNVSELLVEKHMNLFVNHGLNGSHFDLVAGHLVASLQQLNVSEAHIAECVAIVGPLRSIFAEAAVKYGGGSGN